MAFHSERSDDLARVCRQHEHAVVASVAHNQLLFVSAESQETRSEESVPTAERLQKLPKRVVLIDTTVLKRNIND